MHQYLAENPDDHDQLGYITGEAIEITARFTGDVTTINPDTGQQADHAGIYILVGENRRFASYLRNHDGDAFVFGYTVQPDDLDADGISVEGGVATAASPLFCDASFAVGLSARRFATRRLPIYNRWHHIGGSES